MAYTVYKNTNTVLTTLEVGEVDTISTCLDLVGKNVNNYGEYINNNFVRLLTNSAGSEGNSPRSPQEGQLWYNNTTKRLTVFDGTLFQPTYGSHVGATEPLTTSTGDLWYDTINSQLKLWNGTDYKLIGPPVSATLGKFGIEPAPITVRDLFTDLVQKTSVIHSYGTYIGMISTTQFTLTTSSSAVLVNSTETVSIANGLTIFNDLEVKGSILHNGVNIDELPKTYLSSYYDISWCGNYATTGAGSTATNLSAYNTANAAIRDVLALVFPVSDYAVSSEVRVVCAYNTSTSVRHFRLEEEWVPNEVYTSVTTTPPFIQTSTNIVSI